MKYKLKRMIAVFLLVIILIFIVSPEVLWWACPIIFILGLVLVLMSKDISTKSVSQNMIPEGQKKSQQSLKEWVEWETTCGPNASGLAKPGRQD